MLYRHSDHFYGHLKGYFYMISKELKKMQKTH